MSTSDILKNLSDAIIVGPFHPNLTNENKQPFRSLTCATNMWLVFFISMHPLQVEYLISQISQLRDLATHSGIAAFKGQKVNDISDQKQVVTPDQYD